MTTTLPAGGAGKATDSTGSDATSNATGDFTQLIAELLGDNPAVNGDAGGASTGATATAAGTDGASPTKATSKDDKTLTPEMLALGYPIAYALPPQAAATSTVPQNTADASNANADDGATAAVKGDKSSAQADAAQLQQLTQLLDKRAGVAGDQLDTVASAKQPTKDDSKSGATDTAQSAFATLLGKTDGESPPTPGKNAELVDKLVGSDTSAAQVTAKDSHHSTYDQLQQANMMQPQVRDVPVAEPRQYTIHAQVGSHEWAAELGNKLTLMTTQNTQSASLQMTPDNLGPVEVKIEISHNQASVWFTAEQADTRTALEQSLPKLRELFAAQGMSLTDVGVFGRQPQSQSQQQRASSFATGTRSAAIDGVGSVTGTSSRTLNIGLLDTYA